MGEEEVEFERMKDHCEEDPLARAIEDNYVKTAEKLLELGIPAQGESTHCMDTLGKIWLKKNWRDWS